MNDSFYYAFGSTLVIVNCLLALTVWDMPSRVPHLHTGAIQIALAVIGLIVLCIPGLRRIRQKRNPK